MKVHSMIIKFANQKDGFKNKTKETNNAIDLAMQRLRKDKLLDTNEMKVSISLKFRIGANWRKVKVRERSIIKWYPKTNIRTKNTRIIEINLLNIAQSIKEKGLISH